MKCIMKVAEQNFTFKELKSNTTQGYLVQQERLHLASQDDILTDLLVIESNSI